MHEELLKEKKARREKREECDKNDPKEMSNKPMVLHTG